MSYILDALKKAERDRRLRRIPTLGTVHGAAPAPRRRLWPWITGAVLGANAIAFLTLFRLGALTPAAEDARAASGAPSAPAVTATPSQATAPAGAVARPVPAPERADPRAPAVPERSAAARERVDRPTAVPEPRAASTPHEKPTPYPERPRSELRTGATELKLEVLVYSDDPAERGAWINGQRYKEGQRVLGRFVLEKITPDTVILAGDGQRIVLRH